MLAMKKTPSDAKNSKKTMQAGMNKDDVKELPGKQKKNGRIVYILVALVCAVLLTLVGIFILRPFILYNQATTLLEQGQYDEAITVFESLGEYKDSATMVMEASYQKGEYLLDSGLFDEAIEVFTNLEDYKQSMEMVKEASYQKANDFLSKGEYEEAKDLFTSLADYKDSEILLMESKYLLANRFAEEEEFYTASGIYQELGDYKDSAERLTQSNYALAELYYQHGLFELAKALFETIPTYEDSSDYIGFSRALLQLQGTWEKDTGTRQFVFIGWKFFQVDSPHGENLVSEGTLSEADVTEEFIKAATGVTGLFINYDVQNNLFQTTIYVPGGIDHGGNDKVYSTLSVTDQYRKINSFTYNTKIVDIIKPEISRLLVEFPHLTEDFTYLFNP